MNASNTSTANEARAKVLIVEDEQIVAMDLEQRLAGLGYEIVASVVSADEAIEAVRRFRPSVVLMDIRIVGKVDGITAAEEIYVCERTPVVFLTAYRESETLSRVARSGAYGFLVKPFDLSEVRAALDLAVSKHRELRRDARGSAEQAALLVDEAGVVRSCSERARSLLGTAGDGIEGSAPAWVRSAVDHSASDPVSVALDDARRLLVLSEPLRGVEAGGWLLRIAVE